jgi:outer membrane murein-binding lipoprotein Lpp
MFSRKKLLGAAVLSSAIMLSGCVVSITNLPSKTPKMGREG